MRSFAGRVGLVMGVAFVWAIINVSVFGLRENIFSEISRFSFWFETAVLIGLLSWTAVEALQLSVPGESPKNVWWVFLPIAAWVVSVSIRWAKDYSTSGELLLKPDRHFTCAILVIAMAVVPSLILFSLLARAYPLRRRLTGLLAGVSSGGVGALGMQFVCPQNYPMHIFVWHLFPVLICGLLGSVMFFILVKDPLKKGWDEISR